MPGMDICQFLLRLGVHMSSRLIMLCGTSKLRRRVCQILPPHIALLKCFCSIARHKNDPTAKYCQLGTAAIGGGASVRTWVFRGFYEDKGALKFITDRRSQKIPEIAADPGARVGSEGL